mgnify:CR=1 FL=1
MEVQITRPKQYQDAMRNYQLYADGKRLLEIAPNTTQRINIPDYTKYLEAKIDWCSSPKYYLDNQKQRTLIIKNTVGGNLFKSLFLSLYYITLGRKRYLKIESTNS